MSLFSLWEKIIGRFSLVGDQEFFDPVEFEWTEEVESWWHAINRELMHVMAEKRIPDFHDISLDQASISKGGSWKTFFFYAYGERMAANCDYCPATEQALSNIPGMVTAFYSILAPGAVIPEHRGPYKGVLRYHLALRAERGSSFIKVGGESRYWHEGESLIFDDTYPHEAQNFGVNHRIVLFVDFLRPLPFPLNLLNRAVVRYIRSTDFVQAGVRRLAQWKDKP